MQHLDSLALVLRTVDRDVMLVLALSLQKARSLHVYVITVKCDGLSRLFEACPAVEEAYFSVSDYHSVEDAVKCVKNLVQVAWTRKYSTKLEIRFETEEDDWDSAETELFAECVKRIVQKIRVKRCRVEVGHDMVGQKTYFE